MLLIKFIDALNAGYDTVSSISWIIVASGIIMVIHELGHILAIKLSGLNIHHVELGAIKIGKLTLGFVPGGITAPDGYDGLEHNNIGNLKLLLISLGGIIAQIILGIVLSQFTDNNYVLCMFYLNNVYLILNCLPLIEKRTCSDGMKAVKLVKYILKKKYALDEE